MIEVEKSGEGERRWSTVDAASTVARYKTRTPLSTCFLLLFSLLALATVHASTWHVSTTGSDELERGEAEYPLATISHAVGKASPGDEIRIECGVYDECVVSSVRELKFSGSWKAGFGERDLANARTVIRGTNKSSKDVFTAGAPSNTLSGIDLTNGRYGFVCWLKDKTESIFSINHHILDQCVISNNTYGLYDGGSGCANGWLCRSCLFTGNTTAASGDNNNGPYKYFYNCTFADNTTAYGRGSNTWAPVTYFKNCLFLRNTSALSLASGPGMGYIVYPFANDWYGNGVNFGQASWQSGSSHAGFGRIFWLGWQHFVDPKLDAAWRPQSGSQIIGKGDDLSTISEPVTADLYGTAWNGVYDLGCVKATATVASPLAEVYVSTEGDDANTGASAATAKRTVSAGLAALAAGGTCHVANGTYVGPASIGLDGVRLVGESRDGVILKAAESGPSASVGDFVLAIAADNVVVSNVTLSCGGVGVYVPNYDYANTFRLASAVLSGNHHGYWCNSGTGYAAGRTTVYRNRISRCIVRDNSGYGFFFRYATRIDNTLIADNGSAGIYVYGWNGDGDAGWAKCGISLVHVTSTGNTYGYCQQATDYSPWQYFANCIFEGNSVAGVQVSNNGRLYSCAFHGNGTDVQAAKNSPTLYDARYTDPLLDATAKLRGHLLANSPCAQTGTNIVTMVTTMPEAFSNDLDGVTRLLDKVDIGCYISPETQAEIAGNQAVLTVVGTPDGYGVPSPDYGSHLLDRGQVACSVAGTLVTDALDGVRAAAISDSVRAAYRGYTFVTDDPDVPEVTSDTAESANFDLATNATWTVRWQVQNLVVASTDPAGGTVRINDGPAGSCVSNWVTHGTTCTVTFTPKTDYAFDSWSGTASGDGGVGTSTVTVSSSSPRTLVAASQKMIHVAKGGSDETGDGTSAKPFLTIAQAMKIAKKRDIVKVQTGLYEESVTNTTIDQLTIQGGFDATWQRDLRNAQTVVRPPAKTLDGFHLTGVCSNDVSGFVVCGAQYGFCLSGPSSPRSGESELSQYDRIRCLDLIDQVVVSNCTRGVHYGGGWVGVRVYASLLAGNSDYGICYDVNNRCGLFIHNCTCVSNKSYGVYLGWNAQSYEIRNTVFEGNGSGGVILSASSSDVSFWNCLFNETGYAVYCKTSGFTAYPAGALFFVDPKLDADFAPKDGSPCVGAGLSFAGHPLFDSDGDLYGTPWGGVYDIGCFKSSAARPSLADVYVAPDGDDANTGATVDAPMKTPQLAERRVAKGGTLHLAAGEYEGPLSLAVEGMTLEGTGRRKSVVRGGLGNSADFKSRFAVYVAANDVTVRGIDAMGSTGGGLTLGSQCVATNALVESCEFKGNAKGVWHCGLGGNLPSFCCDIWHTRLARPHISHCVISNNTGNGISIEGRGYCGPLVDNTLIVRNGGRGCYLYDYSGGSVHTYSYLAYVTIADNAGTGIDTSANLNSSYANVANSVICRNGSGVKGANWGDITLDRCVLSGNTTDNAGGSVYLKECSTEAIGFDARTGRRFAYHLGGQSAALGLARPLVAADMIAEPTDDLDGVSRQNRRRDAGCFRRGGREGAQIIVR